VLTVTPVCIHGSSDLITCYYQDVSRGLLIGTPPSLPNGPVEELAVGGGHACFVNPDGTVGCAWLDALSSDATWDGFDLPEVTGADVWSDPDSTPGPAQGVAAGFDHACALLHGGRVVCWGLNDVGQLGAPASDSCMRMEEEVPCALEPIEAMEEATELWAGGTATCARRADGQIQCWGHVGPGRIDDPALYATFEVTGRVTQPTWPEPTVLPGSEAITEVHLGKEHACVLYDDHSMRCFGGNRAGQLGNGTFEEAAFPGVEPGLGAVDMVAVGRLHTCALLQYGSMYCWGDDQHGQLGIGGEASERCPAALYGQFPCEPTPQRLEEFGPR
jgi:alpha-tubulin suppressor-like RCC1 family protein